MHMKKVTFLLAILAFAGFGLNSCNKKCKLETEDANTGIIIPDSYALSSSGGLTTSMGGDYHTHAGSLYEGDFTVIINGVESAPDYSQYSILGLPMTVNCNVYFERTVTIDTAAQEARYTVTAYQCQSAKCDQQRFVENFVVTERIPANYTVSYVSDIIETN